MFLSIAFAAVGLVGALYSLVVAAVGLKNGPLCRTLTWMTPFKNKQVPLWTMFMECSKVLIVHQAPPFFLHSDSNYLTDDTWWLVCLEPKNIVQFNIGLFATLLATSSLQVILCAIQMINGLFGCLCGTCTEKGVSWSGARIKTNKKKWKQLGFCLCRHFT